MLDCWLLLEDSDKLDSVEFFVVILLVEERVIESVVICCSIFRLRLFIIVLF